MKKIIQYGKNKYKDARFSAEIWSTLVNVASVVVFHDKISKHLPYFFN